MSGSRRTQLTLIATATRKYGSFSTNVIISSTGAIASTEVVGTLTVDLGADHPVIRLTQLALGATATRKYGSFANRIATIDFSGIASAEVIGSLIVLGGTIVVAPTSIATAEIVGSFTVIPDRFVTLTGLPSSETVPNVAVINANTIVPTMIGDGQKLVSWNQNTEPDLAGYRVYAGISPSVYTAVYDVGLTQTPSTPQYVLANLTNGTTYYVAVTAYDTSNNESAFSAEVNFVAAAGARFGSVTLLYNNTVAPPAITSLETVGTLTLVPGLVSVLPLGLTSGGAIGSLVVASDTSSIFILPPGVLPDEAFGTTTLVVGGVSITLTGVPSSEAVGDLSVFATQNLLLTAIATAEALGVPLVTVGANQTIVGIGLDSLEAMGTILLTTTIAAPSITSSEVVGAPSVMYLIEPLGIVTAEAVGTLTLVGGTVTITLTGLVSREGVSAPLVIPSQLQIPVKLFESHERQFTFKATSPK